MKCPMCDGTGKSEIGVGVFTIHGADCDRCNGKGRVEYPMYADKEQTIQNAVLRFKTCAYCDGTGEHINDANRMTTCEFCGGTGIVEPLTNEDWFCGLSTEEKVKALLDLRERIRQKMRAELGSENKFHKGDYYREWLKEIHEPLKNDEK